MLFIPILLLGTGLAGSIVLARSFKTVQAGTVAVVLRFGKPIRVLEPGLQRRLPGADEWFIVKLAPFVRPLVARSIAHDGIDIGVRASVQLRVIDVERFAHHQTVFEQNARAILNSAANELIGQHDHDELMLKREQFRDQLRFTIDHRLERFGLSAEEVFLEALEPSRSAAALRAAAAQRQIRGEVLVGEARLHQALEVISAEGRAGALKAIDAVAAQAHPNTMRLAHLELLRQIGHPPVPAVWAPPAMWAPPQRLAS
jgi:regulator of protease activity HflC (stomatin/prohibitin superfamily)